MDKLQARQKFEQSKLLFSQKRYPEAMIVLDELNAVFPNERHIMHARALCLEELQRPLEAIQICEQAVAMHNDPKSQELLGRLRREHGPIQEGPTDLASLAGPGSRPSSSVPPPMAIPGSGASAGIPGGLPDIPSMPDMPSYSAMPPQRSNKRFYIILGAVVGLVLIVLIGLPLLASMKKGDDASGTQEIAGAGQTEETTPPAGTESTPAAQPPLTPASGEPVQVQWYYNYDEGKNIARQYDRPVCVFFYDGGEASTEVEQRIFQDPGISQSLSYFINIRVLYDETNQAVISHGVEEVPVVILEDTYGDTVYRAWGDEIVVDDVRAALGAVQVEQVASELAQIGEGASALAFVGFILLGLFMAPWPLYLTLLFTGKLPHNEFFKDILSVSLVAIGADAIAGIVPCFGLFVLIWILNSVYDLGLIDFLIYFALKVVMTVLLVAGVVGIFGIAFLNALPV